MGSFQAACISFFLLPPPRICSSTDLGGFSEGLIGVFLRHCASTIGEGYGTPQTIRQEVLAPELVGADKILVHSQAGQQVGRLPAAGLFLGRVEAFVEKVHGGSAHRLACPSSKRAVLEAGGGGAADGIQLNAGIPGVGVGSIVEEVSAGIVAQAGGTPLRELVGGVVRKSGPVTYSRKLRFVKGDTRLPRTLSPQTSRKEK